MFTVLTKDQDDDESPDVSPDGSRIVFLSRPKRARYFRVEVMDINGGQRRSLATHNGYVTAPQWSPDGRQIVFLGSQGGRMRLFVMDADGGHLRQISSHEDDVWMLAWRPGCP